MNAMPVRAGMELLTENTGLEKAIPMVCKRMKGSLWELSFFIAGKQQKEGSGMMNADNENFELVLVDDIPAIFTSAGLNRESIPKGVFCYDIRHDDGQQGIACEIAPHEVPERSARAVSYANRFELEQEIVRRRDDDMEDGGFTDLPAESGTAAAGGMSHAPAALERKHHGAPRRMPLRTD